MTETPQQLKFERSDSFKKVYANSAQLDITPWDITFTFGEMQRADGGQLSHIENKVAITMSLQHGKALLGILSSKIGEYEKLVGVIQLPQPEGSAAKS